MAKTTVLRGQLFLKEATLNQSLTDRILNFNPTTGEITDRPTIDTTLFQDKVLLPNKIIIGNLSSEAFKTDTALTGDILADTVTALTIKNDKIVNAQINSAAAIAYSKLNLAGGIVNADVSNSAAIVYSKLNLSGSIVNADVAVGAAIARSKTASGTAYRILANNVAGVMSENAALTASRAVGSDANGQLQASTTTFTQLGYSSTLTGDIQDQLDNEIATKTVTALVKAPTASEDGFAITWNDGLQQWDLTDPVIQGIPVAGSTRQFLGKNSGINYDASWLTLLITDIPAITASAAELNIMDGVTASTAEINYSDGVTSNIQTQLDAKQSSSLAQNAIWVGNASNIAAQLSPGTNGYVLMMSGGSPQWQPSGGSQHIIENAGTPLTARANLNFTNGLKAADNTPDTDAKLGGVLTENTTITGTFNLQLGTSGSKLVAIDVYGSSTIKIDSGAQLDLIGFSNVLITAASDQVIINPGTSLRLNNSLSAPTSYTDSDCTYTYAKDISSSSELFVMNEAGVETQLSANTTTAPSTSVGVAITNYYGSSATNFLGDPVAWMSKKIGATTYKIPMYT